MSTPQLRPGSDMLLIATPKLEGGVKMADQPFVAHVFSEGGELLHSEALGVPFRIYFFALQSRVLAHGKHAYVAWMDRQRDRSGHLREARLMLTRIGPATGDVVTRKIGVGHHNTMPSIGAIGDRMLIAFHRRDHAAAEKDGIEGTARIATECVSLAKTFAATKK